MHHEHNSGSVGAFAGVLTAFIVVAGAVALIIALLVWTPWEDDGVVDNQPASEEQQNEGSEVDVNVDEGDGESGSGEGSGSGEESGSGDGSGSGDQSDGSGQ